MGTTSLRDYCAAIEQLIDSNQVEDALAHCRHVLKSHPKNIAIYRLMGKAYLESKRHSEASDLFQRVLSSVPDDFVAHIGMSIIREDEGNLDAAIWHMERAFESQPSNKAVQGEVRRLYGAREGYEPPKVRLTRGALARMYSHGDLYNQAISELRNALAEDAQRPDLQVLLAEMYFKNNQPAEASEVCNQIIQKLPYCLYANRVMVDILRSQQRDGEAGPYWERVTELDPYAAQVSTLKDPEQVPAESVQIEALELDTPMLLGAPPTGEAPAEKEDLPDWLSASESEPDASVESREDSLMSSLESLEPNPVASDVFSDDAARDEGEAPLPFQTGALQPDEIPDWLRELRPAGSPPPAPAAEPQTPPAKRWTEEFKQAGFSPSQPLDLGETAAPAAPASASPEPDPEVEPARHPTGWLPTGELRWMDTAFTDEDGAEAEPGAAASAAPTGDLSAAAGPFSEDANSASVPDWLAELNEAELAHTQPTRRVGSAPAFAEDDPASDDPAPQLEPSAELSESHSGVDTASGNDSDWLNALQAEAGMQADSEAEPEAAPEPDEAASQRLDALTSPTPQDEEQDTLNWLEGLAARQGAAEDELLTDPAERHTDKPAWLQAEASTPPVPTQENRSETLNWLDELAAAANEVDAATQADEPSFEAPAAGEGDTAQEADWPTRAGTAETAWASDAQEGEQLRSAEDTLRAEDSPFSQEPEVPDEASPAADNSNEYTTPGWLRQLAQEMESGAAPSSQPVAPRPLEEAPEWLNELDPDALPAGPAEEMPSPAQSQPAAEAYLADGDANADEEEFEIAAGQSTPARQSADEFTQSEAPLAEDTRLEEIFSESSFSAAEDEPDAEAPAPAIEPRWVPARQLDEPAAESSTPDEAVEAPVQHEAAPRADWQASAVAGRDEVAELPAADLAPMRAAQPAEPSTQAEAEAESEPAAEPTPLGEPALAAASGVPAAQPARRRARGLSAEEQEDRLAQARQALNYGNLEDAAEGYSYFLRRRLRLDDIIADLRAASRRFPRQVAVWQTLGDAYMRNDQLTEALDCYTRAKALL